MYQRIPNQRVRGMTLPEVLISAALGAVIVGAATWFLLQGTKISYAAMVDVENGIQQWGLTTKLQIDGKVANGVTVLASVDTADIPNYLRVVPIDDGDKNNGLERGKVLVLTKSQLNQGVDTGIITDLVFYLYTPGSAPNYGTLKRYPAKAPATFKINSADAVNADGTPRSVVTLVGNNYNTLVGGAVVVQDHVIALSSNGPFGSFGDGRHVSIALVREDKVGNVVRSNLTEVSFNLR